MISDWTIYCVQINKDGEYMGQVCSSCFDESYSDGVKEEIYTKLVVALENPEDFDRLFDRLDTWWHENEVTDLSTLRQLALGNGLPRWLEDLRCAAYPDTWSFPAHPLISVEMGEEYSCETCRTEGARDDCSECEGTGYTPFMCDHCGEELL